MSNSKNNAEILISWIQMNFYPIAYWPTANHTDYNIGIGIYNTKKRKKEPKKQQMTEKRETVLRKIRTISKSYQFFIITGILSIHDR